MKTKIQISETIIKLFAYTTRINEKPFVFFLTVQPFALLHEDKPTAGTQYGCTHNETDGKPCHHKTDDEKEKRGDDSADGPIDVSATQPEHLQRALKPLRGDVAGMFIVLHC